MAALARWQRTIVDDAGNVLAGATIQVNNESGGALATLYSDRAGTTTIGNPFPADSNGFAAFHVLGGAYVITATSGAFVRQWRYVGIGTLQEFDFDSASAVYRVPLLADAIFYISPSGNDTTGDGTVGNPWKTPLKAANYAIANYDFRSHTVTIQFADGTYADSCSLTSDNVGGGVLLFSGNAITPTNVKWTGQLSTALIKSVKIQFMQLHQVFADSWSQITIGNGITWGQAPAGVAHMFSKNMALITAGTTAYTVNGGGGFHWRANNGTISIQGVTITQTINSPLNAFLYFCSAENTALCLINLNTFSPSPLSSPPGGATGTKYIAQSNAVIQTGTTGLSPDVSANYLPGDTAGSETGGGRYL